MIGLHATQEDWDDLSSLAKKKTSRADTTQFTTIPCAVSKQQDLNAEVFSGRSGGHSG